LFGNNLHLFFIIRQLKNQPRPKSGLILSI